ncbi:MAG: hypothetical protein PHD67_10460 [Oscillospiraceae bacterium]|nr:hypothetical protein [Oscillospiraceae bacterium]
MDNLGLYNQFATVPENAKRAIAGGKLKGKTDINPMWRIKALTEAFGPQGTGWTISLKRLWTEPGAAGEVSAWALCELTYKLDDGSWSEPVPGIGGSMLVQLEKGSLVTNDEAYKMAYTDAISVAAKGLGVGSSVYWDKDNSKYPVAAAAPEGPKPVTEETLRALEEELQSAGKNMDWALEYFRGKCNYPIEGPRDLTELQAKQMIVSLRRRQQAGGESA